MTTVFTSTFVSHYLHKSKLLAVTNKTNKKATTKKSFINIIFRQLKNHAQLFSLDSYNVESSTLVGETDALLLDSMGKNPRQL
jgi:hypothetical protein